MPGRRSLASLLAFPLFIALILWLLWYFRASFVEFFRDRESIRTWIRSLGAWGFLAFTGLQALQVILFVLPGEIIQMAGGYALGFWPGSLLSLLGITLGSLVNFGVGRLLGRPFVEALFPKERVEALERLSASGKAAAGFFLFFLIPGIPKDALCYVAGMARISLPLFIAVSMLGRLPGILGSSFMGSAAHRGSYLPALLVFGLASILFILGLVFKERIERRIGGLARKAEDNRPPN